MKKKKKSSVDTRLFIFRNTKKTLKYYFKNIFYVFFMNLVVFVIYDKLFKTEYILFILKFININNISFYTLCYAIPLIAFYTIKVILYTHTIYIVRNGGINDIKDLFSTVVDRFVPVFGTFILYVCAILFFGLLFVIPGIIAIFYFYFSVYLSAIGDLNDGKKLLSGGKALARSYQLVKGNLIRFSLTISIIAFISLILEKIALISLLIFDIKVDNSFSQAIWFTAFDTLVICGALLINKLSSIESDYLAETIK